MCFQQPLIVDPDMWKRQWEQGMTIFFCLFVFVFAGHMTHTKHHMMWSIGSRVWEGFIVSWSHGFSCQIGNVCVWYYARGKNWTHSLWTYSCGSFWKCKDERFFFL